MTDATPPLRVLGEQLLVREDVPPTLYLAHRETAGMVEQMRRDWEAFSDAPAEEIELAIAQLEDARPVLEQLSAGRLSLPWDQVSRGLLALVRAELARHVASNQPQEDARHALGLPPHPATALARQTLSCLNGLCDEVSWPTLAGLLARYAPRRYELLERAIRGWLATRQWLHLESATQEWFDEHKKRIRVDAQRLENYLAWTFARDDGSDELRVRARGFALSMAAAPLMKLCRALYETGRGRFVEEHGDLSDDAVTTTDLKRIAGDQSDNLLALVQELRFLPGAVQWDPFRWKPDATVLEDWRPEAPLTLGGQGATRDEQMWCLWKLANDWLERQEWPAVDAFHAVSAASGVRTWLAIPGLDDAYRRYSQVGRLELTIDGILMGAEDPRRLLEPCSIVLRALAEHWKGSRQPIELANIARSTGLDVAVIGQLLELLSPAQLGVGSFTAGEGEVLATDAVLVFKDVALGDLQTGWSRLWEDTPFHMTEEGLAADDPRRFETLDLETRLTRLGPDEALPSGEAATEPGLWEMDEWAHFFESLQARWRIDSLLGEGGQAWTFRVRALEGEPATFVAKVLKPWDRDAGKAPSEAEQRGRFHREVVALQSLARTGCPRIVHVIDHELQPVPSSQPWYVMPHYNGVMCQRNISGVIEGWAEPFKGNVARVLEVARDIAETLAFMHERSPIHVHRDVHTSNVFFEQPGGAPILGDFGLVHVHDMPSAAQTGDREALGPWRWRPPDLHPGSLDKSNPSSDIYLLGGLIYEALSGGDHIEETEPSPGAFTHEKPDFALSNWSTDPRTRAVGVLLRSMLARDPSARIAASAVAVACARIVAAVDGVEAPPIVDLSAELSAAAAQYRQSPAHRIEVNRSEINATLQRIAESLQTATLGGAAEFTRLVSVAEPRLPGLPRWLQGMTSGGLEILVRFEKRPPLEIRSYLLMGRDADNTQKVVHVDEHGRLTVLDTSIPGDPEHELLVARAAADDLSRHTKEAIRQVSLLARGEIVDPNLVRLRGGLVVHRFFDGRQLGDDANRLAHRLLEDFDPSGKRGHQYLRAAQLASSLRMTRAEFEDACDELDDYPPVFRREDGPITQSDDAPTGLFIATALLPLQFAGGGYFDYDPESDALEVARAIVEEGRSTGDELKRSTQLPGHRINNAVDVLEMTAGLEVHRAMGGDFPFVSLRDGDGDVRRWFGSLRQ